MSRDICSRFDETELPRDEQRSQVLFPELRHTHCPLDFWTRVAIFTRCWKTGTQNFYGMISVAVKCFQYLSLVSWTFSVAEACASQSLSSGYPSKIICALGMLVSWHWMLDIIEIGGELGCFNISVQLYDFTKPGQHQLRFSVAFNKLCEGFPGPSSVRPNVIFIQEALHGRNLAARAYGTFFLQF